MNNIIDKIIYINLDSRKDRDLSIRTQLKIYNLKAERLSASYIENNPSQGCALSHIRCLENAVKNKYENILILEDDFIFNIEPNEFKKKIFKFLKYVKNWDVLMLLGYNIISEKYNDIIDKVVESNTAAGYLVNNHYYKKLLKCFKKSYELLNNIDLPGTSIDIVWKELQKVDNWYIFNPFLGIQGCSYSNLEKHFVNHFNQKYIKCILRGQLGNELFEIANAYYLSKKYGKYLILEGEKYGNNKVYHNINDHKITKKRNKKIIINEPDKYEPIILDRDKNIILDGYYQCEKYFDEIKDEILELFQLNDKDTLYLNELIKKYDINDNSISLHIRRGDYLDKNNKQLFSLIPLFYYEQCIKYFGINKRYIIFSNEIEWCVKQDLFKNLPNKTFVHEKDYIELFLMSKCNDNIIANSTFSWWGAYLNKNNNKKVLIPNRWFNINDDRHYFNDIVSKDFEVLYITNITFVTAYFDVSNKHNKKSYYEWMKNSLNMNYCFVIYILKDDKELKDYILDLRKDKLKITKIIEIEFKDFYVNKYEWEKHELMDTEKYHNKYLYMIWNEKSNLLYKTVVENPFNSEIFFWMDIGYIRDIRHPYYYSNLQIEKIPKDKILLQEIYDSHDKKYTIIGGMFGGYAQPIKKWKKLYYKKLDDYYNENKFCGKDQNIMKDIVENYPDSCSTIKPKYKDDWFYFIWYLNEYPVSFFEYFANEIKNLYRKNKILFCIVVAIIIILIIIFIIYRYFIKKT
jgi:GR25 family glycosyltransferase involved in LPS biosynthesis